MKEKNVNALIELFNSDDTSRDTGLQIFDNIDSAYNVFGSYSEVSSTIFDKLSAEGKRRFLVIFCMSAFELAYDWIRNGYTTWDDRKKCSERFAYNNLSEIENFFYSITKINLNLTSLTPATISNDWFPTYFEKTIYDSFGREGLIENEWLIGYVQKFTSLHSTIKQSYFGGTVYGVVIPFAPNHDFVGNDINDDNIVFPLI